MSTQNNRSAFADQSFGQQRSHQLRQRSPTGNQRSPLRQQHSPTQMPGATAGVSYSGDPTLSEQQRHEERRGEEIRRQIRLREAEIDAISKNKERLINKIQNTLSFNPHEH